MTKLLVYVKGLFGRRNNHKEPVIKGPTRTTAVQNIPHHTITLTTSLKPVPFSDWTGLSISKEESKTLEQRIKRQKARHVASKSDELQRYQNAKLSPTIIGIIERPATSLEYGTLDVFPMELILMIMKELPPESLVLLALTNTAFMGLVDRSPWMLLQESRYMVLGKHKSSAYFRFLCVLETDFRQGPTPMYFCSDCVAFHSRAHFANSQLGESSLIRVCDAAIGVVNLAPDATLTWSKMQDIPNNTVTELTWTIEPKHIPFPRWMHRSFLEQNRVRITAKILKKNGMVCVETQWEMSIQKVEDIVKHCRDHQRKPDVCPGWLCPHNNIVNLSVMWQMWKFYHCPDCPGNTDPHSFLDFIHCHNLRPMRCTACSTDMEHAIGIQADTTKAHYVMTTRRILGKDTDHTSKEWRSQCGPAYDCLPMEHYRLLDHFRKDSTVSRTMKEVRTLREGRHYQLPGSLWDRTVDVEPCPGCGHQIAPTDATCVGGDSLYLWHARCKYRIPLRLRSS